MAKLTQGNVTNLVGPSYYVRPMARQQDIRLVFQHRLKAAREQLQLSHKELGIRAGLDPFVASARINRYELGVHQLHMATAERLATALSVPTAYPFAGD